jgi:hypothetical protein
LLSGHANANTTEAVAPVVKAITDVPPQSSSSMTSPLNRDVADSTSTGKSAEDLLNEREKKLQYRNDAFNKLRAAHMKEFQAKYTAEQQTILQQEIKKKTEAGKMSACVVSSVIMDKSLRS